jgi:hypothetical protein
LLYHISISLAGDNAFFSVFIIYCPNAVIFICIFVSVLVLSSPHRDDGEGASKVQVEDNDAELEVNQEPSALHETPEAILERDDLKIRRLQPEIVSEVRLPFL